MKLVTSIISASCLLGLVSVNGFTSSTFGVRNVVSSTSNSALSAFGNKMDDILDSVKDKYPDSPVLVTFYDKSTKSKINDEMKTAMLRLWDDKVISLFLAQEDEPELAKTFNAAAKSPSAVLFLDGDIVHTFEKARNAIVVIAEVRNRLRELGKCKPLSAEAAAIDFSEESGFGKTIMYELKNEDETTFKDDKDYKGRAGSGAM
mmetsp:Transcript_4327/g.4751  ORF Transcript_4327/g.4751 Transcript_4327/m.4751 type:complete len:204 (+) Transcript_4327:105-716(+)|eukprot:CAMPEP_0194409008 /NCGR_PEP_ID=MMETSP0176-20130528/6790_1 /TAXON_ID=216777 /ORGANISM="Proboscia alata, Strain PI-D3" /LENGTH=203 /DNA_ID=CAMNT_0039209321 /DNA_START=106 /DNA_END=717 /DNA_ORIENTATION=-